MRVRGRLVRVKSPHSLWMQAVGQSFCPLLNSILNCYCLKLGRIFKRNTTQFFLKDGLAVLTVNSVLLNFSHI